MPLYQKLDSKGTKKGDGVQGEAGRGSGIGMKVVGGCGKRGLRKAEMWGWKGGYNYNYAIKLQ